MVTIINKKYLLYFGLLAVMFIPIISYGAIPPTNSFSTINANDTIVNSGTYSDVLFFTSNNSILFNATNGNAEFGTQISYINLEGYDYRKKITVDSNLIFGNTPHLNFPILISINNDPNLNNTNIQSQGQDIRFTSSDGTTILDYEIQSFANNITHGNLTSWVSVPVLSIDVDTILYMYYSNDTIPDGQNPNELWSDYQYVAHLNNDPSPNSILDSTINPKHGTGFNTILIDGKIGKALSFDGIKSFVELGTISTGDKLMMNSSDISISAIIKPELTGDSFQRIISKSDGGDGANGYDFVLDDGQLILYIDGSRNIQSVSNAINDPDQFYHIIITKKHNTSKGNVYVNGADNTLSIPNNNIIPNVITDMSLGTWNHNTGREFNGSIEMLSISNKIPTTHWILTEYINKMFIGSLYDISPQESNLKLVDIIPNTINFEINSPTDTRLGGVYAIQCPPNEFLSGLYSNGTLICSILP